MKELVYGDEFYEFSVDISKNRLYKALRGVWDDVSIARQYLKHNKESLDRLQPGFTSFVDLRESEMPSEAVLEEMLEIFVEATRYSEELGMRKQAQIIKMETKDQRAAAREVMKDSGIDQKVIQFDDPVEAEKWLDM